MISEEDLLDLVNRVKPVVERLPKAQSMKMRQSLKYHSLDVPLFWSGPSCGYRIH